MLHYALIFLIVALIAEFLGFGVTAGTAAWIAKVCFVVFLVFANLVSQKEIAPGKRLRAPGAAAS